MGKRGRLPGEPKPDSLCWFCKNAAGACPWSRSFRDVCGWKAEKTILRGGAGEPDIESRLVLACPLHVPDGTEPAANRKMREARINKGAFESGFLKSGEACAFCARYGRAASVCGMTGKQTAPDARCRRFVRGGA